jgi:CBS domain-containing protein
MICPQCGYENIAGADECENCKNDLTYLDQPQVAAGSAVERALMEQPVRVLEPAELVCVSPETPLRDVIQTMIDKKVGCVLVTDGPELVGIFTERDLLMNIAGREQELGNDQVREWMTPNPQTIEEDDSVAFAIQEMDTGGYRHLPVLRAGRPVSVVSVRDVVRFLAQQLATADTQS